ncbi:L-lactate dehydrogenase complex protein LldG [Murinocardiopsis flavida]|uniref:L-lactate dehydrogenase complex protein LldG n=1 Tax=Murinocardiopsis flavida TaxID=645275 RepID=A0A2P8DL91_9ACTN|nr:lactate utilization protein C [Murinocardiopsis flavida]PSK97979.1 L-lactate dehydrogenase complex protein LldG [Murinocardiopsis flavida]
MSGSRETVLAKVRAALADVDPAERAEDVAVPRGYARSHDMGDPVAVFVDRLVDYKALVRQVAAAELPGEVAAALERRGAERIVAPADLPAAWTADVGTGTALVPDDGLGVRELDTADGVLTGCAAAVAETGTIVCDGGAAQGRRAITLVPDYHLCVVRAEQIVGGVPEAVARLDPARPLTWISGPSATSDIELDRVEGVHGPRTLEVIIVGA